MSVSIRRTDRKPIPSPHPSCVQCLRESSGQPKFKLNQIPVKPYKGEKPRLTKIDYLFLIGGPVLFVATAVIGIMWLLGPPPPKNPVKLIKEGAVKTGMSVSEVEQILGQPKEMTQTADGGLRFLYVKSSETPFVADEGIVEFSATGQVVRVTTDQFQGVPPEQR